ncbi:MEDS domain-containing protein [Actinoplanes sp. CA-030573]|uniref:MEDS domain-containing protein n=1 Tax=Actinoplanes sp. CA-030573 TaxID=3239898 RepID=UPI003D902A42
MIVVPAVRAVADLTVHDHLCHVYDREAEVSRDLLEYVVAGLARRERVQVHVTAGAAGAAIGDDLRAAGLPVCELVERGLLAIAPAEAAFFAGDTFDADRRLAALAADARAAVDDGLTGLRAYVDTRFVLDHPGALAAWPGYELRADLLAKQLPITAVCAYDARHWTPEDLFRAETVHTRRSRDHGAFGMNAGRDGALRLSGEIDSLTADQVYRMLIVTAPSRPTPVLDVRGVSFVDVSGARSIGAACEVISSRHGPTRLRALPPLLRRIWESATWSACFPSVCIED